MPVTKKQQPKAEVRLLIEGVLNATGMTHSELARRCGLSPQAISTYLGPRAMKQMPSPDTVRKLAHGLGVSEADVTVACLKDVGLPNTYEIDVDPSLAVIVAAAKELDPEARARLARIAQAFRE